MTVTTRGLSTSSVPMGGKNTDNTMMWVFKMMSELRVVLFKEKKLSTSDYFSIQGREGVKTVKTLSHCIMSSRPDVMQPFFFPSPQKNTGWPWRGEVWGNSVMWSVCMSVLLFHWVLFFAPQKHRCQGLSSLHAKQTADSNSQMQGVDKLF